MDYLNKAATQAALGVDLNYTADASNQVFNGFNDVGDFVVSFLPDLEQLLNNSVRVAMIYGDADYICNVSILSPFLSLHSFSGKRTKTFLPIVVRRRSHLPRCQLHVRQRIPSCRLRTLRR